MNCYFCNECLSKKYVEFVVYHSDDGPIRDISKDFMCEICMDCFEIEFGKYYTQKRDKEKNFCCFCNRVFEEEERISGYFDFWDLEIRNYSMSGPTYGEICIPCGVSKIGKIH